MYAFSVALTVTNIKVELLPAGESVFIAQLPIDDSLGKAHAFHYTQARLRCSVGAAGDGSALPLGALLPSAVPRPPGSAPASLVAPPAIHTCCIPTFTTLCCSAPFGRA